MSNRWCAIAGLLVLLPQVAVAQSHKEREPAAATGEDDALYSCKTTARPVTITFKPETEVKDLVTWAMGFTCKNFVLDPRVTATGRKVNLMVPNQLSPRDAYEVFLVALSTIGLTVIAKGNVMRVVESAAAKTQVLPIYKQVPGEGERLVRTVIRPSYVQPEALKQAFTALKSEAGDVIVVGAMLVVTDFASTLTGMMSLKKLVDVPGGTEGIYTIPVHHGEAVKLAQMLTGMFGTSPGPAAKPGADPAAASELAPSKILVDDRTNTLVVSATEPAYLRVKALVDRIDVAVEMEGGRSIHAYQLSSAIAEDLAQTLTKAIAGDGQARAQRPASGPAQSPPMPGQPQPPAQPQAAASASSLEGLAATLQGTVQVIPDKPTNKLLITSTMRDFAALKDVIQQLDQPRRQVYIEAMILEVDLNNILSYGASVHGATDASGGIAVGGVQLPQLASLSPSSAVAAGGLIGGLLGAPLSGLQSLLGTNVPAGTSVPSYGLLVQALATRSTTNILSTPSLIALDNEEAKSKIGENVPFLTAVVPAAAGLTTALATGVSRQPLELELDIKPHISAGDTILLEIKHSAGGIKDPNGTLGPTWTTRSVETRVVVRDQQTVLIGGLMRDSEVTGEAKVPVLGDIPILGHLFKYSTRTKHKTNLLIMLTPYIIKDQSDLQQIQQRKQRENNEFFRSFAALESMTFEPRVNYARKRGLIEEINRAVLDVDADIAARAAPSAPTGVTAGPLEPAGGAD